MAIFFLGNFQCQKNRKLSFKRDGRNGEKNIAIETLT